MGRNKQELLLASATKNLVKDSGGSLRSWRYYSSRFSSQVRRSYSRLPRQNVASRARNDPASYAGYSGSCSKIPVMKMGNGRHKAVFQVREESRVKKP